MQALRTNIRKFDIQIFSYHGFCKQNCSRNFTPYVDLAFSRTQSFVARHLSSLTPSLASQTLAHTAHSDKHRVNEISDTSTRLLSDVLRVKSSYQDVNVVLSENWDGAKVDLSWILNMLGNARAPLAAAQVLRWAIWQRRKRDQTGKQPQALRREDIECVLRMFRHTPHWSEMRALLRELAEVGLAQPPQSHAALVSCLTHNNQHELAVAEWLELVGQWEKGDGGSGSGGAGLNETVWTIGVAAHVGARRWEEVAHMLQTMKDRGFAATRAWNILLTHYAKAGNEEKFFESWAAMQTAGVPQDLVSYHLGIDLLLDGKTQKKKKKTNQKQLSGVGVGPKEDGHLSRALRLYQDMRAGLIQKEGVVPTWLTLMCALRLFTCLKDPAAARQEFDFLVGAGCVADVMAWDALLAICEKSRDTHQAIQAFEDMCASGVAPSAHSYANLLAAMSSTADLDLIQKAQIYFEDFYNLTGGKLGTGVGVKAVTAMVEVLVRGHRAQDLERLYQIWLAAQSQAQGTLGAWSVHTSFMSAFCDLGMEEQAFTIFNNLKGAGQANSKACSEVVRFLAGTGRLDEATDLLRDLHAQGMTLVWRILPPLVQAFAQGGRWDMVGELLRQAAVRGGGHPSKVEPLVLAAATRCQSRQDWMLLHDAFTSTLDANVKLHIKGAALLLFLSSQFEDPNTYEEYLAMISKEELCMNTIHRIVHEWRGPDDDFDQF